MQGVCARRWQAFKLRGVVQRSRFNGSVAKDFVMRLIFGYLTPETFSELDELAKTATACLGGLIRYLNNSSFRGRKFKQREDFPNEPKPPPKAANAER